MLAPLKWMKEYAEITCEAHELARLMTMTGTKAESVTELGSEITNVVAGRLLTFERHPNADKLFVSEVDVGGGRTVQIVTGADNIKAGDVVPIALDNSTLPGGIRIKKTKMRGVESQGMMCSIDELKLSKADYPDASKDGIFVLDPAVEPGTDIKEVFGLDDTVIDFEITTNRPDCLCMLGLCREAAATLGVGFSAPPVLQAGYESKRGAADAGRARDAISAEVRDADLCPRYTARVINGAKVSESPEWIKRRLRNCGVRPINNIVDVTNYVMLETGQPLHAFDSRFIGGAKIIVRRALEGEAIRTLDGIERKLDHDMLVIADEAKPIAVAGVMGGENSQILPDTKTVIIESANFDGVSVRRTSERLGVRTESSSRNEKGLDPNMTSAAADRAAELIESLGAGVAASGCVDIYPARREPTKVAFDADRINALLGTRIDGGDMLAILKKVDLEYDAANNQIIAPTYRSDVSMQADLAEEVARFFDYNNIKATLNPGTTTIVGIRTARQRLRQTVAEAALANGYCEICTFSFQSPKVFDKLLLPADDPLRASVKVANPFGEDSGLMRTTALPNMLKTMTDNNNQRNAEAAFFEIAATYHPTPESERLADGGELPGEIGVEAADRLLPVQKSELAVGAYGGDNDFYTLKGLFESVLETLGITDFLFEKCVDVPYLHPGRAARVIIKGVTAGHFGELRPEAIENFSLPPHALAGVLSMDALYDASAPRRQYKALPKYPPVPRDLSLITDVKMQAGDIIAIIKKYGGDILESAEVFDVYAGSQLPEGKKSLAFNLIFRSEERTLTDDEVSAKISTIVSALRSEAGAALRS